MPLRLDWNVAVRYSWIKWVRWSVAAMTLFMQKAKKKFMLHCRRPNERIASVNELCCSCYVFCIHHSKCIFRSLFLSLRHTGKREERKWNGENEKRRIKWWISWLVGDYALHSAHFYACMNNFVGVGLKLIHNGALVACLNAFAGAEDPFTHTCQKHFNVDTKSAFIRMHHSHICYFSFFSKGSTTLRNVRATCWTSSMSL